MTASPPPGGNGPPVLSGRDVPPVLSGRGVPPVLSGRGVPPLALTMGEPAGIGAEITLKAWAGRRASAPFFVIDDPARLEQTALRMDLDVPIRVIGTPGDAPGVFAEALPVLEIALAAEAVPGKPDPANAKAVQAAIETAVRLVMAGEASAVVTNPIHKQTLYAVDFPYPGHTEFLAHLAGIDAPAVMMLAADEFRVVPVTIHLPLADAVRDLNTLAITEAGLITAAALQDDFGLARPRLAVAGLNPHAGEGGAMGSEETRIIAQWGRQGLGSSPPTGFPRWQG